MRSWRSLTHFDNPASSNSLKSLPVPLSTTRTLSLRLFRQLDRRSDDPMISAQMHETRGKIDAVIVYWLSIRVHSSRHSTQIWRKASRCDQTRLFQDLSGTRYYPKHSTYALFFTALHKFFVHYFNFFAVLPETFNLRFEGNALNLSQTQGFVNVLRCVSEFLKGDEKMKVRRLFSNDTRQFLSFSCLSHMTLPLCATTKRRHNDSMYPFFQKG